VHVFARRSRACLSQTKKSWPRNRKISICHFPSSPTLAAPKPASGDGGPYPKKPARAPNSFNCARPMRRPDRKRRRARFKTHACAPPSAVRGSRCLRNSENHSETRARARRTANRAPSGKSPEHLWYSPRGPRCLPAPQAAVLLASPRWPHQKIFRGHPPPGSVSPRPWRGPGTTISPDGGSCPPYSRTNFSSARRGPKLQSAQPVRFRAADRTRDIRQKPAPALDLGGAGCSSHSRALSPSRQPAPKLSAPLGRSHRANIQLAGNPLPRLQ